MSLKQFDRGVLALADARVENYLEMHIAECGERFSRGRLIRNPDESMDETKVKPLANRIALMWLAEYATEVSGLASRDNVYLGAGDVMPNAINDQIRHHLGRIAAIMNGCDPDDFRVKPIDWGNPDSYALYGRETGHKEVLLSESAFFPEIKLETGVSCTYDFSRWPNGGFAAVDISGIAYSFNADLAA